VTDATPYARACFGLKLLAKIQTNINTTTKSITAKSEGKRTVKLSIFKNMINKCF
jgi:hypothetical protein